MSSRAMRSLVALCVISVLVGASVAQAAPGDPGSPFEVPPGQIISGKVSVVHGDNFDDTGSHVHEQGSVPEHVLPDLQYWLSTDDGDELLLEFSGYPPEVTPEGRYSVRGERHGRAFHVSEMNEQAAGKGGGGGNGGGGGKPSKPTASYLGPRDMIVIPFTFTGSTTPLTVTTEQVRERGFVGPKSVRTYYEESSSTNSPVLTFRGKNDGTTSDPDGLPGDVTQTFQIQGATDKCDYSAWATAARAAATGAGWDLAGYEHIVYLFPRLTRLEGTKEVSICGWSGLAQIGGAHSWLNGTIALGTWAHELGHNLTLYHSRTLICSQVADDIFVSVASRCSYDEYGDPFDVMGRSANQRHYNTRNKGHLGWLPAANLTSAVSGQTYTIRPLETSASGLQVLQIPRGREYLYVDFRRPYGLFDNYGATDDVTNGVLIHSGPALATNGNSYLIDTAIYPTTTNATTGAIIPDFTDAALGVGEGFVDPISGVYIETLSVNADGTVTVLVRTGVTNAAPAASTGGGSGPVLPGLPHEVAAASATDVNKNLGRYRWSFVSCPTTCPDLTNAEGGLSGGGDTVPGPTYVPVTAGSYRLGLTVWDANGAATTIFVDERVGI